VRCREAGYHLVVESLHDDAPAIGQQVERMVSALRPDGMILTPPLCDNSQVLKAASGERHPRRAGVTRAQLQRLAERAHGRCARRRGNHQPAHQPGHERIAFIKGAPDQAASGLRYQGYLRAMKTHKMEVIPQLVHDGKFTFASGLDAAHHLLSRR
jgi:LacI family transcriptional regulator